jgi:hypothetical protein
MVSLVAVLLSSVSVFAAEPQPPLPNETTISAGRWKGASVDEFLDKMLDFADKVTRSHSQRDVRPSDRFFDCVMRHLANIPPTRCDQRAQLVELLDSKDSRVRYVALALIARDWNIASQGSTTALKDNTALQARLTELLQDELWETADAAAVQLSVLNPKEWPTALTDHVVSQLKSEYAAEQIRGARVLRTAAKPPAKAEALLLAALNCQTLQAERSEFAWALFHYGKIPAESVPVFIEAMRNSGSLRLAGGGMCCASSSVMNESPTDKMRKEFYSILPLLGPDAAPVIPALIELLTTGDIETRRLAVVILGKFGPLAKAALPHLKTMQTEHIHVNHSMIFGRVGVVIRIDTEVAKACEQIMGGQRPVVGQRGFEPFLLGWCETLGARMSSPNTCCPRLTDFVRQITQLILDGMGLRPGVSKGD